MTDCADSRLSPLQIQVVDALSSGVSFTQAAAQAGIHRNTIANWRRNSPHFSAALAHALYDRALLFRERAEQLADLAFATLRDLLSNPDASPSARLKAATFILEKLLTPPDPKHEKPLTFHDLFNPNLQPTAADAPAEVPAEVPAQECTILHNRSTPLEPPPMHNPAQSRQPYRRADPKIGRNEPCPCGSGRKYKRCCLLRSAPAAA